MANDGVFKVLETKTKKTSDTMELKKEETSKVWENTEENELKTFSTTLTEHARVPRNNTEPN